MTANTSSSKVRVITRSLITRKRLRFLASTLECSEREIAKLTGWDEASVRKALSDWNLTDAWSRSDRLRESFCWELDRLRGCPVGVIESPTLAAVQRWLARQTGDPWGVLGAAQRCIVKAIRSGDITPEDIDALALRKAELIELLGESLLATRARAVA